MKLGNEFIDYDNVLPRIRRSRSPLFLALCEKLINDRRTEINALTNNKAHFSEFRSEYTELKTLLDAVLKRSKVLTKRREMENRMRTSKERKLREYSLILEGNQLNLLQKRIDRARVEQESTNYILEQFAKAGVTVDPETKLLEPPTVGDSGEEIKKIIEENYGSTS